MTHDPRLEAALARGALVVTPNKRLAREIVARHDESHRQSGRSAWPSARVLPWSTFVGDLWQQALDADAPLPPHRLDAAQAMHLWQRIVADDLQQSPLLDAARAGALAAEAWERMHAHGAGGPSWRGFANDGPEVGAFARWAEAFDRAVARLSALDLPRAADAIAAAAPALPEVATLDIAVHGFVEIAPQQRRLLEALAAAGSQVVFIDGERADSAHRGCLFAAATPDDELAAALSWARERAAGDVSANVAIVIHDLHERRAAVRALAEALLCPALEQPGREDAPRPYDLSAGGALADVPLVSAALDLIALAHGPLDRERAAVLVRSRYLPGGDERRCVRAGVERTWLDRGTQVLPMRALAQWIAAADPELAARWRAALRQRVPTRGSPREYADAWRRWLDAVGWCEGVPQDAADHAARGAWNDLLASFVRLTAVAPRMTGEQALRALRDAALAQPFEPEAPGARVRILGVLEAAGLSFDALWVAGLGAEAWPRAPEPNPLLPIDWQRERDVPRASPARELAYARALTASLDGAAPEVVFSYARSVDDRPGLPSPLIAHLAALETSMARVAPAAQRLFDARPVPERVVDERVPPLPAGAPMRGGAALIESQSACPFQAAGRFRLRAEGWPDAYAGLKPTERGRLVHAALAAFWRDVRDHATLGSLDETSLDERLAAAVAAGRAAVDDALWDALPPVVAAVETEHVAHVMREWLAIERLRPPFRVDATEVEAKLVLAGHALKLRIDRVDALADGRRAIVDYKTGRAVAADRWFDERPQGPQLGLYAMALAGDGTDVAALAYAQLKPGYVRAVGLADGDAPWPGLPAPSALRRTALADWADAQRRLRAGLDAIAREVHDGDARVAPRDANACRLCDLKPLCRIATLDEGEDVDDGEGGDA